MKNKNVIRFVESFILLPVLTLSSFGANPTVNMSITKNQINTPEIVSSLKQNIASSRFFAFNQVIEGDALLKAEIDKASAHRQRKADLIDDYFASKNMPLAGYGMKMVEEAEKNDLDYRLLAAISVIESTGGKFACKGATHSFLGWGSCKIDFDSNEKSIEIVSWNLGGNNPRTTRYYQKGMSLEKLLKRYNSVIPTYTKKIFKIMDIIGPETLEDNTTQIKKEA